MNNNPANKNIYSSLMYQGPKSSSWLCEKPKNEAFVMIVCGQVDEGQHQSWNDRDVTQILFVFSLERKLIFKIPVQVVIRLWSELWLFNTFFFNFRNRRCRNCKGRYIIFQKFTIFKKFIHNDKASLSFFNNFRQPQIQRLYYMLVKH